MASKIGYSGVFWSRWSSGCHCYLWGSVSRAQHCHQGVSMWLEPYVWREESSGNKCTWMFMAFTLFLFDYFLLSFWIRGTVAL